MNYTKIINLIITFISLIGTILGYLLIYPEKFGLCSADFDYCDFYQPFNLGEPLLFGLPSLLIISFILLFCSKEIFKSWIKFALVFIPLSIIWIVNTESVCGGLICFNKELVTWICSIAFFVISLAIIITKSILLRKKK